MTEKINFIEFEIDTKRPLAKNKRMVAYSLDKDETYINHFALTTLDILLAPYWIPEGKINYIPVSYLIDSYTGETKKQFQDFDKKIRSWVSKHEINKDEIINA